MSNDTHTNNSGINAKLTVGFCPSIGESITIEVPCYWCMDRIMFKLKKLFFAARANAKKNQIRDGFLSGKTAAMASRIEEIRESSMEHIGFIANLEEIDTVCVEIIIPEIWENEYWWEQEELHPERE